jgi:hypothetical protein
LALELQNVRLTVWIGGQFWTLNGPGSGNIDDVQGSRHAGSSSRHRDEQTTLVVTHPHGKVILRNVDGAWCQICGAGLGALVRIDEKERRFWKKQFFLTSVHFGIFSYEVGHTIFLNWEKPFLTALGSKKVKFVLLFFHISLSLFYFKSVLKLVIRCDSNEEKKPVASFFFKFRNTYYSCSHNSL